MDNPNPDLINRKLGLDSSTAACLLHLPASLKDTLGGLNSVLGRQPSYSWLLAFYKTSADLAAEIEQLRLKINPSGQLWLAWPKKTSGTKSDLTDRVVRSFGLGAGLVDVKVVSLDATWSALKFVHRKN
jgi:hypothetical protein